MRNDVVRQAISSMHNKYNGNVFEIALAIAEYYMENNYKGNECDYIKKRIEYILFMDLLIWLGKNYFDKKTEFDFESKLEAIAKSMYKIKRTLYKQWVNNEFSLKLEELVNKEKFDMWKAEGLKVRFMQKYKKYDVKLNSAIKRDLDYYE